MCVVSFFLFRKSPPDWIKLCSLSKSFCERKRSFFFVPFLNSFVARKLLSKKNTDNNNNNTFLIKYI